jgi:hypothetical protein
MLAKKAGGKRMANQKHLDILKQGVDVWNKRRKEHQYTLKQPDLVGQTSAIPTSAYYTLLRSRN